MTARCFCPGRGPDRCGTASRARTNHPMEETLVIFSMVATFSGATRRAVIGETPKSMMWMRHLREEPQFRFDKVHPLTFHGAFPFPCTHRGEARPTCIAIFNTDCRCSVTCRRPDASPGWIASQFQKCEPRQSGGWQPVAVGMEVFVGTGTHVQTSTASLDDKLHIAGNDTILDHFVTAMVLWSAGHNVIWVVERHKKSPSAKGSPLNDVWRVCFGATVRP